jgi:Kef-type K+ transport system membrane component KefB
MIFESGMHFDFEGCRKVLPKATFVAIFGTFLPILAGMGITVWPCGYEAYPEGLAVGVALAPTSVGIALKLLLDAKVLQKDYGQLILSAAFVDDILSLIIFNILFAVTGPDGFNVVTCVVFPIIGIIFMITFGALGISFWPKIFKTIEERILQRPNGKNLFRQIIMTLMFTLLFGYGSFTMYLGTHLWGAFVAGMSFAGIPEAHHIWSKQTKRITAWMLRVFFSCTVAFAIPFKALFEVEAFLYGSVLGIVGALLTKLVAGVCMGKARFVIGWAMVGRAEFAYLIAEMAKSGGILSDEMFAIVIWALLYATIIAPIAFRMVLQRFVLAEEIAEGVDPEMAKANTDGICRSMSNTLPDIVAMKKLDEVAEKDARLRETEAIISAKDAMIADLQKQKAAVNQGCVQQSRTDEAIHSI